MELASPLVPVATAEHPRYIRRVALNPSVAIPPAPARPSGVADRDRPVLALTLAAAAVCLGWAVQLGNGGLTPQALALVAIALAVTISGFLCPRLGKIEHWADRALVAVLGASIAGQFVLLFTAPPGIYLRLHGPNPLAWYQGGLAVAAVLAGAGLSGKPWLGRLALPALLLVHLALGLWVLDASPDPWIDVYVFQRESLSVLLSGENPYAGTLPNIYGPFTSYYPRELISGSRVLIGYPYPPASLLLSAPGYWLGDVRYMSLLAMSAAAALIGYARPGRISFAAAALLLFTPRGFFVLEQSWTEPYAVLAVAIVVFFALRAPRALPYAVGFLLSIKQYLVLGIPLLLILLPRPWSWRSSLAWLGKAAILPVATILPFFLWDPEAFIRSVVSFQVLQPFRSDALSFLAFWARDGGGVQAAWPGFVALVPAFFLALFRVPRTPAGFAASLALTFFVFFAFNKQAFCNYYYFIIGSLLCAVAVMQGEPRPEVSPGVPGERDPNHPA